MDLEPILIPIDERLRTCASTYDASGHAALAMYSLGAHDFVVVDGLNYNVVLTNTGDGILLTGIADARLQGVCDRCLEDAYLELSAPVEQYYLFEEPHDQDPADNDDFDYELIGSKDVIDIAPALAAALIMETPFVVLCSTDCKGLCPMCGANLNIEPCTCKKDDDAANTGAFAKLSQLKADLERQESQGD